MNERQSVSVGLDRVLADPPSWLSGGLRFGLLMNQASLTRSVQYSCDAFASRFPGQLAAIFAPQHGLWCLEQANMIESPHGRHASCGVPVYSLYSETRRPSEAMLQGLEALVVDLQDVGTRVYTFAWTMTHCFEACAAAGLPVIVLDRPNPIGGLALEGPQLERGFTSFVGMADLPMRHGLTMGELARYVNDTLRIGARLEVVPLEGWTRAMMFSDTGRVWVPPSPNMPRAETALLYVGQVLLEGTNLSEGRGTTTPFEVVGAPFIDPYQLQRDLGQFELPGVALLPVRFRPTFDKWKDTDCGGLAIVVTDPSGFRPYRTTVAIMASVRHRWPEQFRWRMPPYEYESEKMPIDILSGSTLLREAIDNDSLVDRDSLDAVSAVDAQAWRTKVSAYKLYR